MVVPNSSRWQVNGRESFDDFSEAREAALRLPLGTLIRDTQYPEDTWETIGLADSLSDYRTVKRTTSCRGLFQIPLIPGRLT
jgi:hypothetical protein